MTECNGLPLEFSTLGRQKIHADFNGARLTSDAGAVLLREVAKCIGLMRWCDKHGENYIVGLAKNAVLKRLA